MLTVLVQAAAALGFAWGLVMVHESGHLLAGRARGVPAAAIRVRMASPPHVALLGPDGWRSPDDPDYVEVFRYHDASGVGAVVFISAGIVAATAAAMGLFVVFDLVGRDAGGTLVLVVSLALLVGSIVVDLIGTWRSGRPHGDVSALWNVSPVLAGLVPGLAITGQAVLLIAHVGDP